GMAVDRLLLESRVLRNFRGRVDPLQTRAFSPDGKQFSLADMGVVTVLDAATRQMPRTLKGHTGGGHFLTFNPHRTRLASGCDDHTIKFWDAASSQEARTLQGPITDAKVLTFRNVAFSPAGTRLASASADNTVKEWDVASGLEVRTFQGHIAPVYGVAF